LFTVTAAAILEAFVAMSVVCVASVEVCDVKVVACVELTPSTAVILVTAASIAESCDPSFVS
jgi:hypothetical protein